MPVPARVELVNFQRELADFGKQPPNADNSTVALH